MTIYLDTNVYCRPFDDQLQIRIEKEADAFVSIIKEIKTQGIRCLLSDILKLEVELIKDPKKKLEVQKYLQICSGYIEETEQVVTLAEELVDECKLGARDALHLASALLVRTDYFITCDDKLEQKARVINRFVDNHLGYCIKIRNPVKFLSEIERSG